jgi:hypothetical protein
MRLFHRLSSRLERACRRPQSTGIDALRVEFQHPVVQLSRGRRRLGYAVEIADVLPGLFNDLGAVGVTSAMARHATSDPSPHT